MSSTSAIRLVPEVVRSLGFASISTAYAGVGSAFDHPIRIIFIQNLTDETLMFSFDGVDDHFPLAASGFLLLDVTANKVRLDGLFLPEGDRIYVKEVGNPTSGNVYVTTFYGEDV